MFGFDLQEMLLGIPGLVIAMTFHEYAHARAAVSLGDFTPRLMGRLTLNPTAHIDPIGLLMLFLVRFGWAKPVMINPSNFRQPKRDDILVSLAGPMMNLFLGFVAFYVMLLINAHRLDVSQITYTIIQMIFVYNVNFAIFNMLPIPPLDGSRVLYALAPEFVRRGMEVVEQYGVMLVFVLVLVGSSAIGNVMMAAIRGILQLFSLVFGVSLG